MSAQDPVHKGNAYVQAPASDEWVPMTSNGTALTKPDDDVIDQFRRGNAYVWDGNDWVPMEAF